MTWGGSAGWWKSQGKELAEAVVLLVASIDRRTSVPAPLIILAPRRGCGDTVRLQNGLRGGGPLAGDDPVLVVALGAAALRSRAACHCVVSLLAARCFVGGVVPPYGVRQSGDDVGRSPPRDFDARTPEVTVEG